jgi:hypothetical protein
VDVLRLQRDSQSGRDTELLSDPRRAGVLPNFLNTEQRLLKGRTGGAAQ